MSRTRGFEPRIVVALDTDDWDEFRSWCRFFGPRVGVLKVGLQAYLSWGERAVAEARESGHRVFLDLKLHDIPNTVAGAVAAARRQGADLLTVHAAGGRSMLRAAVEAAAGEVQLLAITLLTHLDTDDLVDLDLPGEGAARVARWAELAASEGVDGAVCSPRELERVRLSLPAPFILVAPGIRPRSASAHDQRRVATPGEAIAQGADLIVLGRPLTRASDAGAALSKVLEELHAASI